jgi:hypothetical protein
MRSVFLALCFVALGVCVMRSESTRSMGGNLEARVQILVTDGLGRKLEGSKVSAFRALQSGRDFAGHFHEATFPELHLAASGIPYGRYNLKLLDPEFGDISRNVDVDKPVVRLVVPARTATVHLVPLDTSGLDLREVKMVSFVDSNSGIDLSGHFRGNEAPDVPYGSYTLRARTFGTTTMERSVDVFQPDVWVVLGLRIVLELPSFPAPTLQISGRVRNIDPSTKADVYLRLVGVYTNYVGDAKLEIAHTGESGTFTFNAVIPDGKYVLITTRGAETLDMREVKVPARDPLEIDLRRK